MHTLNEKIDFSKVYEITWMRKFLISLKQLTLTKTVQVMSILHEDDEYSNNNLYCESPADITIDQQPQALEEI